MTELIHFIGIGGAGLSALAQVMLGRGFAVSGSDPAAPNRVTDYLVERGAKIFSEHAAGNIAGADLIVTTSAARADNPEIIAAHLQHIPIFKRREFLREVTRGYDVIAVAGSHGKTTTTAMIARILQVAGLDPTAVVGGTVPEWETNARVGSSRWFVIEADEYDYAFLGLEPKIAVLTNVDYDHPDLFPTRTAYQNAFEAFLKQTRRDGVYIVWGDDGALNELAQRVEQKVIRYGVGEGDNWRVGKIVANASGGSDFSVFQDNHLVSHGSLQIPGTHNVLNALAALVAAQQANVDVDAALNTLKTFGGVARRFQVLGSFHDAVVVDDYAHHPTEIRATLGAARMRFPNARIFALFQPHTFSRTHALLEEFAKAFDDADVVLVVEIYAARERDEAGLSSQEIVARMNRRAAHYVGSLEQAEEILRKELRAGDVLITLGAGNVNRVAQDIVSNKNA